MDQLIGMILFGCTVGAVALLLILRTVARFLPDDVSTVSERPVRRYVDAPARPTLARPVASAPSRVEVEAEVVREAAREGAGGLVTLTEKALQSRDEDNVEKGMILAFAALQKGGYLDGPIKERKLSEMKQLIFKVAGGRKLGALNAAIDAVPVPVEPAPPADEEAPRTPLAGRPIPAGVTFDPSEPAA